MLNQISDYELMDMYWTQHMSGKEIAAVLGCTPAAVCMRMKSSGIKARSPHNHPNATKDGYVMKHILVMERKIGRYLNRGEVVHHINHVRDDNQIENLRLMTAHDHMSMHMKERHKEKRASKC